MPSLHIHLLGTPYLTVDGLPVTFKRSKALALLAYLALAPGYRCRRETLTALLWPDYDDERARAGLRRTLAAITETAARPWLYADRQHVALDTDVPLWVDVGALDAALAGDSSAQESALELYRDTFMTGFSLTDAAPFDEWQASQAQALEAKFSRLLERLTDHYLERRMVASGLEAVLRWLRLDPYHEAANLAQMRLLALSNQAPAALQHYRRYAALLQTDLGAEPPTRLKELARLLEQGESVAPPDPDRIEVLPPPPRLMVGREDVLADLRARLTPANGHGAPEVVIQGWPGIGKTTLSTALAHDPALHAAYPGGVMWVALGEQPDPHALLAQWCHALKLGVDPTDTLDALSGRLRAHLAQRRVLLLLDDVWEVAHVQPFRVAGRGGGTLMSTRFNDVARALVSRADDLYKVPLISDAAALELLVALAPSLRHHDRETIMALVHDLEGLPLALQVAGRLLHAEASMGWGITDLIAELRDGRRLLEAQAPPDRHEVARQTSPTIAALLQRSIDRLTPDLQEKFALLGVFAPKPASFTLAAVQAIWRDDQPQAALRTLTDRGLLEPSGDGRFQMHALLVMHARSLFGE